MKDTLDGDAHTNIMFEVDAIVYQKNEIINGCRIIKKEPNGIIHGKSPYAGVQLSIQPNMSIFKEGDVVPVIVKRVRYNVNQIAASVLAIPFIPIPFEQTYYNITGVLTKQQTDTIKNMITQINTVEEKIKNMNNDDKKIYSFFVDLISPSKVAIDKTFKTAKKVDINNILDVTSGIVFRPDLKYNDSSIYHVKLTDTHKEVVSNLTSISEKKGQENLVVKTTTPQLNNVVDESIYIVLYEMLIKYFTNIQSLQNFLIQYPTFDAVQSSKHIWKMYSSLKH
jgi:nitrate reductase NapAB chaperone NapD